MIALYVWMVCLELTNYFLELGHVDNSQDMKVDFYMRWTSIFLCVNKCMLSLLSYGD